MEPIREAVFPPSPGNPTVGYQALPAKPVPLLFPFFEPVLVPERGPNPEPKTGPRSGPGIRSQIGPNRACPLGPYFVGLPARSSAIPPSDSNK